MERCRTRFALGKKIDFEGGSDGRSKTGGSARTTRARYQGRVDTIEDIAVGDNILFYEPVWFSSPKPGSQTTPLSAGYRVIAAEVVRESYGPGIDLHSMTLRVVESSGRDPIKPGAVIWRKRRSIQCNGCWRRPRRG